MIIVSLALVLLALPFPPTAHGAGAAAATVAVATVDMKVDMTALRVNCQAVREYAQLHEAPMGSAFDQINARIRRELTVGKKLCEEDCPEASSSEDSEYHNWAKVTSQRAGKIGVNFLVAFPGGSGRAVRWCDTYDLKTGHEVNLRRCLKPEVPDLVKTRACELSKKSTTRYPPGHLNYFCGEVVKTMTFCWDDGGIRVLVPRMGDWKFPDLIEVELKTAELKGLVTPECVL